MSARANTRPVAASIDAAVASVSSWVSVSGAAPPFPSAATPKSTSTARCSRVTRMLDGLMSRCTTSRACSVASPSRIPMSSRATARRSPGRDSR